MGIPWWRVDRTWEITALLIDKAIQTTDCDFDIDDVHSRILNKEAQLWAWIEGDEITACFVTTILINPKRKICSVPLIGGTGLKIWRKGVDETLGTWAKAQGCEYLEGYARKGWLRVLKDWFIVSTTIRRKL